ncbi:hypothetical protein [Paenibacillus sp. FSL R7-0652]|uniref:Uncharacterized protein n=1 Tax=Paenibacillus sp. AN1007 TaxID=3151385 RepID=A0AAU8NMD8_9BACL
MKRMPMVFSFILIIVGIIVITLTKTVEEVIPKLGYAVFQFAGAGSYSPTDYEMDLNLNYWVGGICILTGTVYFICQSAFLRNSISEIKMRDKEFDEKYKQQ